MKIIKLIAENIMKLSAVEIVPSDNLIMITGENGAGKSSILDSIVMALAGGKAIPECPIKKGKDKGKIIIEMEDYTITRSFTKGNSYLKIEKKDGQAVKGPQKFLDDLLGKVSFDPLDFINRKKDEQIEVFLNLIGVDVKKFDAEENNLRKLRQEIGSDLKRAEAELSSIPLYNDIDSSEIVSIDNLSKELSDALSYNSEWDRLSADNESKKSLAAGNRERINKNTETIKLLQEESAVLEAEIEDLKRTYQQTRDQLKFNPKKDIQDIQNRLSQIDSINEKKRSNLRRKDAVARVNALSEDYKEYTKHIEKIETDKQDLLSSVKIPIPGLSVGDAEIMYNGIPLSQCSDGEKLMVSLSISMALNPNIRVLRIKDGSLLDSKNREIIQSMIKDRDFQLWMEVVSDNKALGIYIEEGEIVSINGNPVECHSNPILNVLPERELSPEKKEPTPTKEENLIPATPDNW